MDTVTLASKLGTTTHISPLLRKAERLGLDATGLEALAIERGCDYYHDGRPFSPTGIATSDLSNTELAVALLHSALPYSPQRIRLGAAMAGATGQNPAELAHVARMERCQSILRYIAEAGKRFEPENVFWQELLKLLDGTPLPKSGVVPHPTRFVAMTGITRNRIQTVTEWIRPTVPLNPRG